MIEARGAFRAVLDDEIANMTRDHARDSRGRRSPIAQDMHRRTGLFRRTSSRRWRGSARLLDSRGHGGTEMGLLTMAVLTEELSSVSLVAGSLITRSEILTRASWPVERTSSGSTWLPRIASGELLVGVAATEPDIDPTWPRSVARRCEESMTESRAGSSKGRRPGPRSPAVPTSRSACPHGCDVRRQPRPVPVHRPEGPYDGHHFEHTSRKVDDHRTANPTPGYRGMHSFTLAIDHYFVPEENLVGGEEGLGKGFYLQMGGFEAGRLQTGARATGVSQASIEKACTYTSDRKQFERSPTTSSRNTRWAAWRRTPPRAATSLRARRPWSATSKRALRPRPAPSPERDSPRRCASCSRLTLPSG